MATSLKPYVPSSILLKPQSSTPLLMHGTCTFAPGTLPGAIKGLDETLALTNTDAAPMMVTGLRFRELLTGQGSGNFSIYNVSVRIKLGNSMLTNGFVPLSALCTPIDGATEVYGYSSWRFVKPMILYPQERLHVEFQTLGGTGANSLVCRVGMVGWAGSTLSKLPVTREVPFATHYLGAFRNEKTAGQFSEQSDESHLLNPFSVPLFAETFIGRFIDAGSDYGGWGTAGTAPRWTAWRDCQIRLEDSTGASIQRTPVPFSAAFDLLRRRWPIQTWMPPKHFFIARIDGNYAAPLTAGNVVAPLIGLIGYRTERV
jgi:hypothetical protein